MKTTPKLAALFVCLYAFAGTLPAQSIVRLKKRTLDAPADMHAYRAMPLKRRTPGSSHYLVQFSEIPTAARIDDLRARGLRVLSYIPDAALVVSAADETSWDGLGLKFVGRLDELDKVSEEISPREPDAFVVVEFHHDVDMQEARPLILERNLRIVERETLLPNQLLVEGPASDIQRLAEWDEVAYIFPASKELQDGEYVIPCAGAVTENGPVAQYVKIGPGWSRAAGSPLALKYYFGQLTSKLPASVTQAEILRAFDEWSRHGNVTFAQGDSPAAPRTIHIFFAQGAHGDPYTFDGPGRVLGHTFYPPPNPESVAGDMHLDADEAWRAGASVDLYSVVLHELGHALGLAHSDKPSAVMYPYYKLVTNLTADDIAGIQDLYGVSEQPGNPAPAPAPEPAPAPAPAPAPNPAPAPEPKSDTAAPTLRIVSPSLTMLATSAATLTITGTASDNVAVAAVRWTNTFGQSGEAAGAASWRIQGIPLLVGTNRITVKAYDAAGNSASRTIAVVRR